MVQVKTTIAALALSTSLTSADRTQNAQRAATLMTIPVVITLDDTTATATPTPTSTSTTTTSPSLTPEQILDQRHPKICLHWDSHWWPSFYVQMGGIPESEVAPLCRGIWDNLHHRRCTVRGKGHYCGLHWGHRDTLYWEFDTYGSCSPYQVEAAFYWATDRGRRFGNVTCTRYEDSPSIRHWDEHYWGNDYWSGHKLEGITQRAEQDEGEGEGGGGSGGA